MKKTLIATASALACVSALSQVTLYGVADAGITHVSGYAQGSVTQLSSGIMDGSRWGVKGTEDMGGGYKALFTLESRVELTTGGQSNRTTSGNQLPDRLTAGLPAAVAGALTNVAIGPTLGVNLSNAGFDRQAWVGLVTPIGGFLMGRQYTPAYETVATFDIMATQSALSAGQVAAIPSGVDIRYNNALQYRIVQGPWNAALMYGFGQGASSSSNRLLGINTTYKSSAFNVGFGYNTKKNSAGQQALKTTLVGASATQSGWTFSGLVGRIEEPNPSSGPELAAGLAGSGVPAPLVASVLDRLKQDANLMHIGLRYDLGAAGQVTVAYTKLDDKRATNADTASYGVAYTYPLSKRTNLSAVLTRFSNSGTGQAAPGGAGYLGGVTGMAGQDATSIALGVRHTF
jgi:predicted porin